MFLIIWICFEFRISSFEFVIYLYLAFFASSRLAPWNTHSTEAELFAQSAIPQGEVSFFSFCNLNWDRNFQISLTRSSLGEERENHARSNTCLQR